MNPMAASETDRPAPRGLIQLPDGKIVTRRQVWSKPGAGIIRCHNGHRVSLPLDFHTGAITVRCSARSDGTSCGLVLYVATGEMGLYYIDLTQDEAERIRKLKIPPTQIPEFLGL